MIIAFIFCTSGCTASKETLTVFNWGEYISDGSDDYLDIISAFEEEYGVKVNYLTFDSNESMYTKLDSGRYDLIIPSDYMVARLISEDKLAEIDFNNIPNYKYIDVTYKGLVFDPENKYSVPYTWGTVGIVYNKTMVEEPPTGYDVLWDERYKGQILMVNNVRDAFSIAQGYLGYSLNTTDKDELYHCYEALIEQKPLVQAYVMDEIYQKMIGGNAAIGVYYAGDVLTMIDENPDLEFILPEKGTNMFVDSMCIPKNAKNKKLAEKFINFMLKPDISAANIDYIYYSTPSTDAFQLLDEEVQTDERLYPSKEYLASCETYFNLPKSTRDYMSELWIKVKNTYV